MKDPDWLVLGLGAAVVVGAVLWWKTKVKMPLPGSTATTQITPVSFQIPQGQQMPGTDSYYLA